MENVPQYFQIDLGIVDTIIGSMHFDVDDEYASDEEVEEAEDFACRDGRRRPDLIPLEIKKWALDIFISVQDVFWESDVCVSTSVYEVKIKNGAFCDVVVKFKSLGLSFRLTSRFTH